MNRKALLAEKMPEGAGGLQAADDADFLLENYDYALPEDRIAQHPAPERAGSRLLVLRRADGTLRHARFADLLRHLPESCLLVANNSRVIPARIHGRRDSGGAVEFLLLTPPPLLRPDSEDEGNTAFFENLDTASDRRTGKTAASGWRSAVAEGLLRSSKKARPGERLAFAPDFSVEVLERGDFGRCSVRLYWRGELPDVLERIGKLPLPPYIRRPAGPVAAARGAGTRGAAGAIADSTDADRLREPPAPSCPEDPACPQEGGESRREKETESPSGVERQREDRERYQTVYADPARAGSAAAPTAGLHFTPEMLAALRASGREWAEVTLYVGYGTFSPVRCRDIREHRMHTEYAELPPSALAAIEAARAEGRAVIAVGTTAARTLEGVAEKLAAAGRDSGEIGGGKQAGGAEEMSAMGETVSPARLAPFAGELDTFLYPGRKFRIIDGLITNFHLPQSSLLMLVSALAGRERVLAAYREAVAEGYRFFSYGDAMLIL